MGYSYFYLFCILLMLILVMRFFIPFIIYLLPILLIVYVIKALFSKKHTHNENTQDYHEQETTYHQTHDDIIDVDYKVVDEEDDHND